MNNKLMGLLGLSMKAGKAFSGEFAAEKNIKSGCSGLVILAEDASEGTRKKFTQMCNFYNVPVYMAGEKETLGRALGKGERSVISVGDENFAEAIKKLLEKQQ